jgi:hypothetical protein
MDGPIVAQFDPKQLSRFRFALDFLAARLNVTTEDALKLEIGRTCSKAADTLGKRRAANRKAISARYTPVWAAGADRSPKGAREVVLGKSIGYPKEKYPLQLKWRMRGNEKVPVKNGVVYPRLPSGMYNAIVSYLKRRKAQVLARVGLASGATSAMATAIGCPEVTYLNGTNTELARRKSAGTLTSGPDGVSIEMGIQGLRYYSHINGPWAFQQAWQGRLRYFEMNLQKGVFADAQATYRRYGRYLESSASG